MSVHAPHTPISVGGLSDGCERCEEIAGDPFAGLDNDNLRQLIHRTGAWMEDREFSRSDAELIAMRQVETAILHALRLINIGYDFHARELPFVVGELPVVSNDPTEIEYACRSERGRLAAAEDGPSSDDGPSDDGPSDDEIYNRPGVEGGIAYPMDDAPGSLGENDWRL